MKQETPAFLIEKTGDKATLFMRLILQVRLKALCFLSGLRTLRTADRILLRAVPLLSRESRCVKRDPGRSPDFRSLGVTCKPNLLIQNSAVPSHQFDSGFLSGYLALFFIRARDRSQWRGRGGFSPRFPILRNSAPEPLVYSIVITILYHIPWFFANFFVNL